MDIISRLMYGSDERVEQRNVLWNMLGSLSYAMVSMCIGIAVSFILGATLGGIFFFAFSTLGQQLYILSYFGIRPIQITDTSYEYGFGDYLRLRLITSFIAIILGIIYTIFKARNYIEFTVYILMILYKVFDAIADCYESEWQRKGKLYIGAKSLAFRTLLSLGIFLLFIIFTKDIIISGIAFLVSLIICIYILAIRPLMYMKPILNFNKPKVIELFSKSKWLFVSSFLDLFIFAASKFAVNSVLGGVYNSYYSTIFIPTSIINLMAGFIIRPILSNMSSFYDNKDDRKLTRTVLKISAMILIFTLLAILLVVILGKWSLYILLRDVDKADLGLYTVILGIVILGGGFYALMNLMYYILVIFKKEREIFVIYMLAAIIAVSFSSYIVKIFGMFGAALSYLALMLAQALIFSFLAYSSIKQLRG